MKSLNKQQQAEKGRICEHLRQAASKVESELQRFDEAVQDAAVPVQQAIESYNEALRNAAEFVENVASDLQSVYDEKSEKWQESERGENFKRWIEEWESIVLDDAEIEIPESVEPPDLSAADNIELLTDEAD